MRAITLAEANRILEGTFAAAEKRKAYALAAIVLDAGGRGKAFQKQDGASRSPAATHSGRLRSTAMTRLGTTRPGTTRPGTTRQDLG
jgi:uncharacterized protein GlcG (DUF336 family)